MEKNSYQLQVEVERCKSEYADRLNELTGAAENFVAAKDALEFAELQLADYNEAHNVPAKMK